MSHIANKISIVTPSFNQVDFIEQTISSVLDQHYDGLEYIIIDGGSGDGSAAKIQKVEHKLKYWVSEKDNGQSHAINKGFEKATGKIWNWLNSDDYYEPNTFIFLNNELERVHFRALLGRSRLFNESGTIRYSKGTDIYHGNLAKTIGWARIDQPESFFTADASAKVGQLNESLHYCMDREWWIRYLYCFGLDGVLQIPKVLVNFRIHNHSKTMSQQSGFLKEHHSIFYQIGRVAGEVTALKMMKSYLELDVNLETKISEWSNKSLAKESFHYYLLKTADEFYAVEQYNTCKNFLNEIDATLIQKEDLKLYHSLLWKSKLPNILIKLLRKIKIKIKIKIQ